MRVAVCLHGQPRSALQSYENIKHFIIEPNNADVFIHMNIDEADPYIEKSHINNGVCSYPANIVETIKRLYSPKKILTEKPKKLFNKNIVLPEKRIERSYELNGSLGMSRDEHIKHTVRQKYSHYYSIYKCNELKEMYSLENEIVYDFVVSIRFDAFPKDYLRCSSFSPDYVYSQYLNMPDNLINDWLVVGSNLAMNIYASLFLHMEYLNTLKFYKKQERSENTLEPSDACGGWSECLHRDLLDLHKIPRKTFNIGLGLH